MSWFNRHLNWTWIIGFVLLSAMLATILYFGIIPGLMLPAGLWIILIAWVLSEKNRSGWWIIPTYFIPIIPLVLSKKR
jgi:hypothetical protein